MNKKNTDKEYEYTKEFRDKVNDMSKFSIEIQVDSFNAIDTKSQTYISIIAIFIAILLGILAFGFDKLSYCEINTFKVLTVIGLISFLINLLMFFYSVISKQFKSGVSPHGLNNMKDSPIGEVDMEIFSNFYWSVEYNKKILDKKARWLKYAEWFLVVNFVFSIIIYIYFISII
ncbi:hypothetical protein M0R04_01300 [Candidatus Dojkabacteria bacterium]|jgi:hypothetical protein|nr:hypothetical protein [Candidatus Dojkabacteria bacterium]